MKKKKRPDLHIGFSECSLSAKSIGWWSCSLVEQPFGGIFHFQTHPYIDVGDIECECDILKKIPGTSQANWKNCKSNLNGIPLPHLLYVLFILIYMYHGYIWGECWTTMNVFIYIYIHIYIYMHIYVTFYIQFHTSGWIITIHQSKK